MIPACSSIETWDGQRGQPFRRGPRNKCTTFGTLAACEARGSRFAGRPCSCPVALLADRQQLLIAVGLRKGGCVPNNTPVIKAAQASQAHCRKYVVRCLARTPPCSVIQIRELCRISYGVCDSWPRSGVDVTRGESACARLPVRCQKQSPQLLRGCVRASRRRQSSRADGAPGRGRGGQRGVRRRRRRTSRCPNGFDFAADAKRPSGGGGGGGGGGGTVAKLSARQHADAFITRESAPRGLICRGWTARSVVDFRFASLGGQMAGSQMRGAPAICLPGGEGRGPLPCGAAIGFRLWACRRRRRPRQAGQKYAFCRY